jgi:hypothetical protein
MIPVNGKEKLRVIGEKGMNQIRKLGYVFRDTGVIRRIKLHGLYRSDHGSGEFRFVYFWVGIVLDGGMTK